MKSTRQTGDTALTASTAYPGSLSRSWPDSIGNAAFHGPAGRFVELVAPETEADPAALLLQFLVGVGNLVGRTAHFRAEADRHYSNLFLGLVGVSSKGRKGTSRGHVDRVLSDLDCEWTQTRQQGGLSSGEGLIWAVRDPIWSQSPVRKGGRVIDYEEVQSDAGISDKRLLVFEPELASTLRVMGRDGNTLSPNIRQSWDTGSLRVLTKNSPATATDAHISIVGHVTKDELCRYLDRTEVGNGFANRFLWICVRRSQILPEGGHVPEEDLSTLVAELGDVREFASDLTEIRRDSEARDLWYSVYPRLSEGKPGLLGAVTSRAEAQVMRLALVYAILDRSTVISLAHLQAALAVWGYAEASAEYIFGDAVGDPVADEILRALRVAPEGMTRTELRELFKRNRRSDEIGRALAMLEGHGLVRSQREETDGRPAERWFAVPGYAVNALNAERGMDEGPYRVNGVYRVSPECDSEPRPSGPQPSGDSDPSIADPPESGEVEEPEVGPTTCCACGGSRFWISTRGDATCGNCHPPAMPDLVDHWTGNPKSEP